MAFVDPFQLLGVLFTSSPGQVRKRARWRTRARPDPSPQPNRGDYRVTVPSDLQKRVRELMNMVAPALSDAFDRHMQPLAENAFDEWPVKTGFSKSTMSLTYFVEEGGSRFRAQLVVRAPYAAFIREKGKRSFVARRLLFVPLDEVALLIARDAINDLAKAVR